MDCMHAVMKRPDCDQGTRAAYVLTNASGADQGCVGERGATCAALPHIVMMTITKQKIYIHGGGRETETETAREWVSKRQRYGQTDRHIHVFM